MSGLLRDIVVNQDGFTITAEQDVEPILENNKRLQNDGDGYSPTREFRRVASIPNIVIEKWINDYGVNVFNPDHKDAVRKLLNSNEWRHLRTAPGRL